MGSSFNFTIRGAATTLKLQNNYAQQPSLERENIGKGVREVAGVRGE